VKVAIITPHLLQATTGNAVTVRRLEHYLSSAGLTVRVFSLDASAPSEITRAVKLFSPDVIHAIHAVRSGPLAASLAEEFHRSFIVTITGTDLYRDMATSAGPDESGVIEKASAVVTFQQTIADRVSALIPASAGKVAIITQGVELPEDAAREEPRESDFIFLLPAGLRPVKNVLFPFQPLSRLRCRYPQIRLVLAGPPIDPEYSEGLLLQVAATPFSSWLGEVRHSEMSRLYRSAGVVLNTSLSEGGMANSLLEAMAHRRPVLASDVEGNRFLENGVTGLLYTDEEDFLAKAERLILDDPLREKLAEAGMRYLLENCSPEVEAGRYVELYKRVT
jgi:glycosyltransferase involved in cell wall biosynthesis